jgi:PKD domain
MNAPRPNLRQLAPVLAVAGALGVAMDERFAEGALTQEVSKAVWHVMEAGAEAIVPTAQAGVGTWDTERSVDAELGTNYDGQGWIASFAGTPAGLSYVGAFDELGTQFVLETRDGWNFMDVTDEIRALDPEIEGDIFITGYAPDQDAAILIANGYSSRVDNFSAGVANWILTPTDEWSAGLGSVDNLTGDMHVTKYFGWGDDGLHNDTTGDTYYNPSGDQDAPISDSENARYFYANDSATSVNAVTVRDYDGNEVEIGGDWSWPSQANPAGSSVSITGSPEIIYAEGDWTLRFAVDTSYTPPPVDSDLDGHASDADCDDEDASVYPGAPVVLEDEKDNDCVSSVPTIGEITIGGVRVVPRLTEEPVFIGMGESIALQASGLDDEEMGRELTYLWEITGPDGLVTEMSGDSVDFTPTAHGIYDVQVSIVDSDGNSVGDGGIFTVNLSTEALSEPGAGLEDGVTYYEIPSDPEAGGFVTAHGYPYVNEDGVIVLFEVGDGLTVSGLALDVSSIPSGVDFQIAPDTLLDMGVGGSDLVEVSVPFAPMASFNGPYSDTNDTNLNTFVTLKAGSFDAISQDSWDGETLDIDATINTPGDYQFADTVDNRSLEETDTDTDTDSDSDTDTDTDADADADTDTDTGSFEDTGTAETAGGQNPPDTGCSTVEGPNGETWALSGLAALATFAMARRKRN